MRRNVLCRHVKFERGIRLLVAGQDPIEIMVGRDPRGKTNQIMMRMAISKGVVIENIDRFERSVPVRVNHVLPERHADS